MDEAPKLARAIIDSVRGQELHVLKHPDSFTPDQVTAADALARVTLEEFAQLYAALDDGADQRRTEAN